MPITLGILAQSRQAPVAAGSYDLLETYLVPSGGVAGVTFSNLNSSYGSTYKHLQVRYSIRGNTTFRSRLRLNGDDGTNYATHLLFAPPAQSAAGASATQISLSVSDEVSFSAGVIDLLDAFSTSKNKTTRTLAGIASASFEIALTSGVRLNTAAITTLNIRPDSGLYAEHSRFSIYGLKG